MSLKQCAYISLPEHRGSGGFDHAAIHGGLRRLYVAHTANDAIDVVDCESNQYLRSIGGLTGVAGALVCEEQNLVFTSNRGEDTIGIFAPESDKDVTKVEVGKRPNGLAYCPDRRLLLAANVGDPSMPGSTGVTLVDVRARTRMNDIALPGRTRWTVYSADHDAFFVNVADPPQIAVIDAGQPDRVDRFFDVPSTGPHGLDFDQAGRRLFCACDGRDLVVLDAGTGMVVASVGLAGVPDVISFNAGLKHLYVAIGDPGLIEVFDTRDMSRIEVVETELGAHTIAFDSKSDKVYAFLLQTHRAAVFSDITD